MVLINCDIGERGLNHPVDLALMDYIGMANIACGGHAGDEESVAAFMKMAAEKGIKTAAHLSYPDRAGFGRTTMSISDANLLRALHVQMALMPEAKTVKFHGALYNNANVDSRLAGLLAQWMKERGIQEVVTMFDSDLAAASIQAGLAVIREAFAERRYSYDPSRKQLALVDRKKNYARIKDPDEAIQQSLKMVKEQKVLAYLEDNAATIRRMEVPIEVDTLCIHSDSEIALELAKRLWSLLR